MKKYVKPAIEVTALASSTPIAAKNCVLLDEDMSDWDFVRREVNDTVDYLYVNGSN